MADGAVTFLLEKLSTLLTQNYTQLEGLEKDVQHIINELQSMLGFLRKAEAKQDYDLFDAEQQAWIKQVREVAYDMEDAVDEYLLRFAHHIHGGDAPGFRAKVRRKCNSVKNLPARHQISSKIKDIKERVEHIAARHKRYQSTEGSSSHVASSQHHPIQGHALLIREADLVGIEEPKQEIISLILNDNSQMKAISVVGMGGLGKTTLVKRVYEDLYVKQAFSIHAWLTIAMTFRIEDALKDLIRQICEDIKKGIPDDFDYMDANRLGAYVKNILRGKRYIIVLDDLWILDQWTSLKYVFPDDDSSGSCIIITTRNVDVANTCCRQFPGNVHRMRPLSWNQSWDLFCIKAFGQNNCPPHLKGVVDSIVGKCEGLPLGIVAIGGLLASKDTNNVVEWDTVYHSLGSELQDDGELKLVRKILLLSYNDLPYHLKSCLLYMGIFPEDTIVDTEILAYLWIAEGFVNVKPRMTATAVAQSYLNELIHRSLIQVSKIALDGRVESCRVHDLIHKLILSKCGEYNILTPASTRHTAWPEKVRRLVVNDSTCPNEPVTLSQLRTLWVNKSLSDSSLSKLLNGASKLLKVLHLRDAQGLSTIPEDVFKLSNLTYLNLAGTNVTSIPKSICKLQNLQFLDLKYSGVKMLPGDIIKLNKLYYLNTSFEFKAPKKLGELFLLQYLRIVKADNEEVMQEIGKLTELRVLEITGITRENGRELCSSLQKLTNLQTLYIKTSSDNEIIDLQYSFSSALQFLHALTLRGPFVNILDWIPKFQGLSILCLDKSCLKENQFKSLAGLPNLVQLRLLYDGYEGNMLHFMGKNSILVP